MNSNKDKKSNQAILGMVTVNEKGQVVIPVDARESADIHSGDKLLVMFDHKHDGIFFVKPDRLERFANQMLDQLSAAKNSYNKKETE